MTQRNQEREAAFELGRQLAAPGFRQILAAHGHSGSVQDVVVTLDDTTVSEVLDRVFTRCRPPALVAIRRPREEYGFVLLLVEPSTTPARPPAARHIAEPVSRLSEDTSIGMLYDSMQHTHGTIFEIGRRRSYEFQRLADGPVLADA